MEVIIEGQTISNFNVKIADGKRSETFDIQEQLAVVDASLDLEVRDAAAQEHFWNQIAITAEEECREFEGTFYNQYLAHTEKYARYYLKGSGEKNPTGVAKEKCASLIFADEVDEMAEAAVAYLGYKEEMGKISIRPITEVEFHGAMYHYGDSYEQVERNRLALEFKAKRLKAVSAAFNTKSWSVKTAAADRRALMGAHIG